MDQPGKKSFISTEQQLLSTAQVANALGVSVTTVKRWVDDRVLPAHRTPGGHRKLRLSEVLKVIADQNLPVTDPKQLAPPSIGTPDDPASYCQALIQALNLGDLDRISHVLVAAQKSGMRFSLIADRILSPALAHVGHLWETRQADVLLEHRVMQICIATLYEMRASLPRQAQDLPVAIGGAPEHDHYILPSLMAKLTLLETGWQAINLGPHTPFSAFRKAIEEFRPRLIWLSVTHIASPEVFFPEYQAFFEHAEQLGVAVAIGGGGLTASNRSQMPYTFFGDGMTQLASFARTLNPRPQRPKRGRPRKNG